MLADILQTCLTRIAAGDSVDACLATYPQQRAALETPLRVAVQFRALPRPALPDATRAALETRMLALAAQRRAAPTPASSPNGRTPLPPPNGSLGPAALLAGLLRALGYRGPLALPWLRVASVVLALVLALVLGAGAFAAARAIVRTLQGASSTPTITQPATTPFTLDGPIEQIAPARWVVNDIAVTLDPQTTVNGTPAPGAVAHIRGVLQSDGSMLARMITIDAPLSTPANVPLPTNPPAPAVIPTSPPTLLPTATSLPPAAPLPAGTTVNVSGDIQQISITNNVTTIVVNDITYVLPRELVVIIGKQLRIGVPIVFIGQVDSTAQIIIINVVQINHQRIVIHPPKHDDDEGEGDD